MPSPLHSSFASAAAGNNQDGTTAGRRMEGSGSGDWSRTRTNGATQTFRRPSLATTPSHQRESSQNTPTASSNQGVYVPPHLTSSYSSNSLRNGAVIESRYSKDQLLGLYTDHRESSNWGKSIPEAFMGGWNPHNPSAGSNGASWGKKDEKETASGPELCWVHDGTVDPLGLIEMNEEEREVFSTSVNSPLKPPTQSGSKESTPNTGPGGRKTSISQGLTAYNSASPSARPGNRRRETGDSTSLGNPLSPTGNTRFFRDEPNTSTPPPSLLRRKTDYKDPSAESRPEEREKETSSRDVPSDSQLFGSLKRSTTAPMSAGLNGPSSPWSAAPSSATFSPMGAFGNFSLAHGTAQPQAAEKKPAIGGIRGESRFKGLLSKDSSEDMSGKVKEKSSFSSLERLSETEVDRPYHTSTSDNRNRAFRSESNPFGEDEPRVGSAALGGLDLSPPSQIGEHLGLSAFGLASKPSNYRDFIQQDYSQQQTPQAPRHGQEPMSPTNTNPYQSPDAGDRGDGEDIDTDGSDIQHSHLHGLPGLQQETSAPPFSSVRRGGSSAFDSAGDRSQNSSAGGNRGFPNIGGFPGLTAISGAGGWPSTTGTIGSPNRGFPPSAFGDPLFGPMGDIASPSMGAMGAGGSFFGPPSLGPSSIGRSSKMGSLFPAAMQEQMRGEGRQGRMSSEMNEQGEPIGRALRGSSSVESPLRGDPDAPLRNRGFYGDSTGTKGFDDSTSTAEPSASITPGQVSTVSQVPPFGSEPTGPAHTSGPSLDTTSQGGQNQSQSSGSPASNQLPTTQQRQMVMPDRMRWIYRDPQGATQGPWSGLEMHDWYKAGFFTAELLVKKQEDLDYEPLAQLIRRIGNSREPFLVPQIGIPHGPPTSQPNQWPPTSAALTTANQPGVAQPPFANSFPSFGTTLTAEQQNALERRKQEEQYLMARQKEHLAQQQVMLKQMQQLQGGPHGIHPHQLQHHSSAHSLHSQPSFGSITSPAGYQPSPNQGPIQPLQPVPGFPENTMRPGGAQFMGSAAFNAELLHNARGEELTALLERMNTGRGGQVPFNTGSSFGAGTRPHEATSHNQQVTNMLQDRARLQREQEQHDLSNHGGAEQHAHNERLRQFHALQSQTDDLSSLKGTEAAKKMLSEDHADNFLAYQRETEKHGLREDPTFTAVKPEPERLSLAEQVQQAAAQQIPASQTESPWGKVETSMPLPFPPPQSTSPLPAPAAQRNRQNVADTLAAESRSQSQTPVDTPSASIAPWAKETNEGQRGPSLKEIQEAEARKAAQQEEAVAATRRALADQERLNQPLPSVPAPGLPSTSTWGNSGSPSTPTSAGSVWAKPPVGKTPTTTTNKKTLAQIQKEEEVRKQRLASATAQQAGIPNVAGVPGMTGGKRYADLAGKIATSGPMAPSGAWTTVGASGKVRTPSAVVATPVGPRAVSGGNLPPSAPAAKTMVARPVTATRPSALNTATSQSRANDEFTKWAKGALGKGLNNTINVDDFVQQLLLLPPEAEIISDSVYANSQTLDGRRFAEEFIRRRKLADKGIVDPTDKGATNVGTAAESKGASGGWSEVAKKGGVGAGGEKKEEVGGQNFRVVPSKKKGKR